MKTKLQNAIFNLLACLAFQEDHSSHFHLCHHVDLLDLDLLVHLVVLECHHDQENLFHPVIRCLLLYQVDLEALQIPRDLDNRK